MWEVICPIITLSLGYLLVKIRIIMDANIGAKERVTQNRLIGLFKNVLKYTYLGNWETREDNANIEEKLLTAYLLRRGYTDKEIRSAIVKLKQSANSLGGGLYNANKDVYTFCVMA